ncbi:MAG: HEAT repeat domain-containing protein [Planctomycetes bacterium]|nr:HEAT repeat domain-containing protein [Planctomycetota bacterium]
MRGNGFLRRDLHPSRIRGTRSLVVFLPMLLGASVSSADDKPLEYGLDKGQRLAYSVHIELDRGDYIQVLTGTPQYTVSGVNQDGIELQFRGKLQQELKPKDVGSIRVRTRMPSLRWMPSTGLEDPEGTFVITRHGRLVSSRGDSQLPGLLGNLSELMFEPLAADAAPTWEVEKETAIVITNLRFLRAPFLRDDDEKRLLARETGHYTRKPEGDEPTIDKKYELKTAKTIDGQPQFEISGEGTLVFDAERGAMRSAKYQQTVIVREELQVTKIPVTVSYRLLDEAEMARIRQFEQRQAELAMEQALKSLDDPTADRSKLLAALRALQNPAVAKPDADVARKVAALLKHKDDTVRYMAGKALTLWATEDVVPDLVAALGDSSSTVRSFAMEILARFKAEDAIEPIAQKLADAGDRYRATDALKAFGAPAEDAVLKRMADPDWRTRLQALRVLQAIATQKSVPALEKALSDEQALIRNTAQQVLGPLQ